MTLHVLMKSGRAAAAVACAVMMFGCPDKPEETASGTGSGSETEGASVTSATGSGPTSDPTTSGGPGGTQGGTDGMTSTTSQTSATTAMTSATSGPDGTSTGGGPGSSTGGGVPPEVEGACMAACDKIFECVKPPPFPDVGVCTMNCAEGVMGDECVAASVQFNTCLSQLSCPELIDAVMNEDLGMCMELLGNLEIACQGCAGTGSQGMGGCSIGQECPNQPPVEYVCEGDKCTCMVDGMPTGMTCPANGVCEQGQAALSAAANECCGFML